MTWTQADPSSCCADPHHSLGSIRLEGPGVRAYATCQNCGAESRDVFLDGHTEDYDFSNVPNDWAADTEYCAPDTRGKEEEPFTHKWTDWQFNNEGERVEVERECTRCQTTHQRVYVYRYTEYDDSTLPAFTEGDGVWYEPDPDDDSIYAEATVMAADHDAQEYEIHIEDVPVTDVADQYDLEAGRTYRVSGATLVGVED